MSEKRKRLDLDEVRNLIELEKAEREQVRIANSEKIANKIVERIANQKAEVYDGKIRVRFGFWNPDLWVYDESVIRAVLRANGLRLEVNERYNPYGGKSSILWGYRWPIGVWFEVVVGLFEFADSGDKVTDDR